MWNLFEPIEVCVIRATTVHWGRTRQTRRGPRRPAQRSLSQAFAVFTNVQPVTAVENGIVKYHVQVADFTDSRESSTRLQAKEKKRRTIVDVNVRSHIES